jgi:hypothetical protein
MSSIQPTSNQVYLDDLKTAFPARPLPRSIAIAGVYDSDDISRAFSVATTDMVSDESIYQNRTALGALTPAAFEVLFPKYLEYVVRHPMSDVTEKVSHFLVFSSPTDTRLVRDRLDRLTVEQLRTVEQTLAGVAIAVRDKERHLATTVEEACEALRAYKEKRLGRTN